MYKPSQFSYRLSIIKQLLPFTKVMKNIYSVSHFIIFIFYKGSPSKPIGHPPFMKRRNKVF